MYVAENFEFKFSRGKATLTLNGMRSEKSTPPPPLISIVWRSIETKFGCVKVCHKFYPNDNKIDDAITGPL